MAQNIIKQRLYKNGSIIEGSETVAGKQITGVMVNTIVMSSSSIVIGSKSDNNSTELQETVEVLLLKS